MSTIDKENNLAIAKATLETLLTKKKQLDEQLKEVESFKGAI